MTLPVHRDWSCRSGRWAAILLVGCSFVATVGCGGKQNAILAGKVTLDGQPLPQGQVVFEPRGPGRMSVAQISEGAYRLPAGFGLPPGEYIVRITSERPSGRKAQPAAYSEDTVPVDIYEQFLPAKYNTASELVISVSPDAKTAHDFSLSMK